MKRVAALLLVVLMIFQMCAVNAEGVFSDWYGINPDDINTSDYHTVTFISDGQTIATTYIADGDLLGSLPESPSLPYKRLIGWYGGHAKASPDTVVTSDTTYIAVYAELDPSMEEKKVSGSYHYNDRGDLVSISVFGYCKKNQQPGIVKNGIQNDQVLESWTVEKIKNNSDLTLEAVVTSLPESASVSAYRIVDGELSDLVAESLTLGQVIYIDLSMKGANGIAFVLSDGSDPDDEDIALVEDGAIWANEDLYLTGKIPGNGIVQADKVLVQINGEDAIVAYDIKIFANENQRSKGKTWQPADKKVQVHLRDDALGDKEIDIFHMNNADAVPEFIGTVAAQDGWAVFDASSFSIYAATETVLTKNIKASDGNTYEVSLTYDKSAGIQMYDTDLSVSEILPGSTEYADYLHMAAETEGFAPEEFELSRVFDIKIIDTETKSVCEPTGKVNVSIRLIGEEMDKYDCVKVYHFEDNTNAKSVTTHTLDNTADGEYVNFQTDGFSVYAVTAYSLEKIIDASDGNTYKITVTYGMDAGIPAGSDLQVTEINGDELADYLGLVSVKMQASRFDYAKVFDIKITHDGQEIQPAVPVHVSIRLLDHDTPISDATVVHFAGEYEEAVFVETEFLDNEILFNTDHFSAYAVVEGPEAIDFGGWRKLTSIDDLRNEGAVGVYIGHVDGYYFTNGVTVVSSTRKGITKTKPATFQPPANAAKYYFEPVSADGNQFYVYCYDGDTKKYVRNEGNNSLLFASESDKTAFTVTVDGSNRFMLNNGAWYWNMQGGKNGQSFCSYNNATDGNNRMYIWFCNEMPNDPYHLDGATYGLVNWNHATAGRGLMATSSVANNLDALPLTIMTKAGDEADRLLVPNDTDLTMWTFHNIANDEYYVTAEVGGVTKYLRVDPSGLSVVDTPDTQCVLQVIPGTGQNVGMIYLRSNNSVLTYSQDVNQGFSVDGIAGSEWLRFVEVSELTSEYFMTYSARKVSVSDSSVTNGSRIIVYTRVWNNETKEYEYFAVSQDGTIIPCFESGDSIQWVGSRLNTMLWNFVEYYWEGTNDPNFYYELYNQYSSSYMAPQTHNGQVLSPNTIGINLNGRRNGQYYSSIAAWDDAAYAYSGLKVEGDHLVSCPLSEADDFYFAILQDIPIDDALTTIPTVNHTKYGITMKIKDFVTREEMSSFLGSDAGGAGTVTQHNLLSNKLGADGYPTTAGGSLGTLYAGASEVNHLFIQSTYNGTGYFEYDSSQNFASLQGSNFRVYQQLGSYDSAGYRTTLNHGQFFPFNDIEPGLFTSVNSENLYYATGAMLPDSNPRKHEQLYLVRNVNCYFGLELEASFMQTPSGLDAWGHEIIYQFTGDDDFWLYVDGELLIDLGGIHSAVAGSVNYSTGAVYVNGVSTTLREVFKKNYKQRKPSASEDEVETFLNEYFEEGSTIFKDYSTHTMRIFYMERGAGASNLHMRFNLASVKPGTIELTKTLNGLNDTEDILAEFLYQVRYKTDESQAEGALLAQGDLLNPVMYYKDSTKLVPYRSSCTVDGVTYNNVFLIKPGDVVEIDLPDNAVSYQIIECGVNTDTYSSVKANKIELVGTSGTGYPANRKDYATDYQPPLKRTRVTYDNEIKSTELKNLTITKVLFREDGVTPITSDNDDAQFGLRLYLGTEFATSIPAANMYTYYVKNELGEYCGWDKTTQQFVSTGKTSYAALSSEEKSAVSFSTSMNGSISKIPAAYTIEVSGLLSGTQFKVVERPSEIPDGYSFQKYVYDSSHCTDAMAGVSGTLTGSDAHIDVCNLRGWGLRVNKTWSDDQFMDCHDDTYYAVYMDDGNGNLTLVADTERCMHTDESTLYWYFPALPDPTVPFMRYLVQESTISSANPTIASDGTLTNYGTITPVHQDGTVYVNGRQKGQSASSPFPYTAHYERGPYESDTNVRVDTITNTRPGIKLVKQDMSGTPLSGATFTLTDDQQNVIGTFTSDSAGLITVAYLREDIDYQLSEIKSPQGYFGLQSPITLRLSNGVLTVTGCSETDCELTNETGYTHVLIVKNRPYEFRVLKCDANTSTPLQDAVFALHRQKTVDGVTMIDLVPMSGYDNLVTNSNGIVPLLDNTLQPGVYELREKTSPFGYQDMNGHIRFTVSDSGVITLNSAPTGVTFSQTINDTGIIEYVITVPNTANVRLTIEKIVCGGFGDKTELFEFELQSVEDETANTRYRLSKTSADGTITSGTITTAPNGNTFELAHGDRITIVLPSDKEITIYENNKGYITKWRMDASDDIIGNTMALSINSDTSVVVENRLDAVSPTDYKSSAIPYIVMSFAGIILLFVAKAYLRKKK